jgi:hypothetical protein
MAETPKQNNDDTQPPFYVEYGVKEREQFLSDMGNYTSSQLEVFQTLCKLWQPEIPYAKFLSQVSGAIKNVASELERVISRLAGKKCGLIKIHYSLGEEVRDSIILTSPGSPRYFYFSLLNALEVFFSGIDTNVPYADYLESQGLRPPFVQNLERGKYGPVFEDSSRGKNTHIYKSFLPNAKALLLPAGGGIRFINFCLAKLREAIADINIAAEVARLQQLSLSELRKRVEGKDPLMILSIAKNFQQVKQSSSATKRVPVSDHLFQYMGILSHLIECNLEEIKRRKGEEEDRMKDKTALALLFEKEADPVISQKRFGELCATFREKYKNNFEAFRREFTEQFIANTEEEKLPVLIHIFDSYIHRNNFFQVFLSHFNIFRENANQFTVKTMEVILRTNNRADNAIFYSRENFDAELGAFLRKTDPFLSDMFAKPRILSEALIYTLKEKKRLRDLNLIKAELEKYFMSDTMQLKGFSLILNISLVDIFQRAFERLAWWRQIFIKFTGKYASYQAQYAKQGYKPGGAAVSQKTSNGVSRKGEALEPAENLPPSVLVQQHTRKGPQNIKKKAYTKKQQEHAWNEFSKTLRAK